MRACVARQLLPRVRAEENADAGGEERLWSISVLSNQKTRTITMKVHTRAHIVPLSLSLSLSLLLPACTI